MLWQCNESKSSRCVTSLIFAHNHSGYRHATYHNVANHKSFLKMTLHRSIESNHPTNQQMDPPHSKKGRYILLLPPSSNPQRIPLIHDIQKKRSIHLQSHHHHPPMDTNLRILPGNPQRCPAGIIPIRKEIGRWCMVGFIVRRCFISIGFTVRS